MNRQITTEEFKKVVIKNEQLSLVQFKKEWNGASQIIAPVYNDLADTYNGIVDFFTVDLELEPGLDQEFGVRELPTILFFIQGKVIDHAIGLTAKNILISKIELAIAGKTNS